jgi:hypothetical protein
VYLPFLLKLRLVISALCRWSEVWDAIALLHVQRIPATSSVDSQGQWQFHYLIARYWPCVINATISDPPIDGGGYQLDESALQASKKYAPESVFE